jgi:hypothetical protein
LEIRGAEPPELVCSGPQRVLLAEIAEHYKIELIENEFVASRKPVRQQTMF